MGMVRLVLLGLAIALCGVLGRSAPARGGAPPLPSARVAPADALGGDDALLLSSVLRSEARARALVGRPGAPIVRRCVAEKHRRLRSLVRTARAARRGGPAGRVKLTRAYLEAVILADEARRCGELVVHGVPPGRTLVTVEVDPAISSGTGRRYATW